MEKLIILQGITVEELFNKIELIVQAKLEQNLDNESKNKQVKYLAPKEVCEILHITKPTLHAWCKQGLLNSYRIGNRVYYKSDEIDPSMKKRKYFRY